MPLYEYTCRHCGQHQEHLVSGSTIPECVYCGSSELTKELSVFARPARNQSHCHQKQISGCTEKSGHPTASHHAEQKHCYTKSCNHSEAPSCSGSYVDKLIKKAEKLGVV